MTGTVIAAETQVRLEDTANASSVDDAANHVQAGTIIIFSFSYIAA